MSGRPEIAFARVLLHTHLSFPMRRRSSPRHRRHRCVLADGRPRSCAPPAALRQFKFNLGWKVEASGAGFLLAQQRGYYKDAGLDVVIDTGNGSASAISLVAGGAYDICASADLAAMLEFNAANPAAAPQGGGHPVRPEPQRGDRAQGRPHPLAGRSGGQDHPRPAVQRLAQALPGKRPRRRASTRRR